jgi:hypothetical protein
VACCSDEAGSRGSLWDSVAGSLGITRGGIDRPLWIFWDSSSPPAAGQEARRDLIRRTLERGLTLDQMDDLFLRIHSETGAVISMHLSCTTANGHRQIDVEILGHDEIISSVLDAFAEATHDAFGGSVKLVDLGPDPEGTGE